MLRTFTSHVTTTPPTPTKHHECSNLIPIYVYMAINHRIELPMFLPYYFRTAYLHHKKMHTLQPKETRTITNVMRRTVIHWTHKYIPRPRKLIKETKHQPYNF